MINTRTTMSYWTVTCLVIPLIITQTNGADPVYSNATISDASGNSADSSASITWANLPAGSPYTAGSPSRVSAGLEPYYSLMHTFIGIILPSGIPDSIIEHLANGTTDQIISNYSQYVPVFIGYAIGVAIGVLFLLIFPIIACCFCCCRICGNCGGKRIQSKGDAKNVCKRNTLAANLALMLVMTTVGIVCVYINNGNTSTAINGMASTGKDNLEDVKLFINNTVDQANHIGRNNFEFLKTALLRDIDNIAYLVGIPLRTAIQAATNIDTVFTQAYALNTQLNTADTRLEDVNNKTTDLKNAITALETALTDVKDNLDIAYTACGAPCSTGGPDYTAGTSIGVDSNQFPDLTSQTENMANATNQNLTAKVAESEQQFDDIPWTVHNDSETSRNDMKTSINNLSDDIDPMLNKVDDINKMVYGENATVDLDDFKSKLDEYGDLASQYDKYRWYGGIGLAGIVLLIVLLGAMGLLFGLFGCDSQAGPTERGCLSNSGGNILIASAAFVFIFADLLMLLTLITFMLGAPMERFVCQAITDPSLTQLEKLVDETYNKISVGDGKYFLGNMFYSNSTIPLTLTGLLRDCKENKGAFEAFQLSSQFDINDILNYSKKVSKGAKIRNRYNQVQHLTQDTNGNVTNSQSDTTNESQETLDVDAEISKTNVDLSGITIYPDSLKTQLDDLRAAVNINFQSFYDELNKPATNKTPSILGNELDAYAATIGDPFKSAVNIETGKLYAIQTSEYAAVEAAITALNTSVKAMEDAVSGIPTMLDTISDGLNVTELYIHNNGSDLVKSLLRDYASRLTGIADSYVTYTDSAVKTQLGACSPIWNVYNSFLVYTFCYNLLDTLNGFWFSLGWCMLFFIPGMILSIKLAKFYRKMDAPPTDDMPPKSDRSLPSPEVRDQNSRTMFKLRKNKVQHYDGTGW